MAAPPPAAAAAASAEKRRVEFDAEQSPSRRGRPGADSPPVPSVDEELRQLEGKLSARCAQCGAAVLLCPHGKQARRCGTDETDRQAARAAWRLSASLSAAAGELRE